MTNPIQILVNGHSQILEAPTPLKVLLENLKIDLKYLAVALNEEVIPHSQTAEKMIQNGDKIEIIRAVAGG